MPIAERDLAKFRQGKKDTLIYKAIVDGNNLTTSIWSGNSRRQAKIYRKSEGKKSHFADLNYDGFWEK
ncbi:MAG: hypothetical protein EOO86_09320 [Pedobacter sp.]|nr:MAG: hypothetical protein EOO86_09320 [Pedobacter sp.]